jgi:hypothetical protein
MYGKNTGKMFIHMAFVLFLHFPEGGHLLVYPCTTKVSKEIHDAMMLVVEALIKEKEKKAQDKE